jgi:hypothetical protein
MITIAVTSSLLEPLLNLIAVAVMLYAFRKNNRKEYGIAAAVCGAVVINQLFAGIDPSYMLTLNWAEPWMKIIPWSSAIVWLAVGFFMLYKRARV